MEAAPESWSAVPPTAAPPSLVSLQTATASRQRQRSARSLVGRSSVSVSQYGGSEDDTPAASQQVSEPTLSALMQVDASCLMALEPHARKRDC